MKNSTKAILSAAIATICAGNFIFAKISNKKAIEEYGLNELQIENVEAEGGILGWFSEWWNRPDYACEVLYCSSDRSRWSNSTYDFGYRWTEVKDKGNGQWAHSDYNNCDCDRLVHNNVVPFYN